MCAPSSFQPERVPRRLQTASASFCAPFAFVAPTQSPPYDPALLPPSCLAFCPTDASRAAPGCVPFAPLASPAYPQGYPLGLPPMVYLIPRSAPAQQRAAQAPVHCTPPPPKPHIPTSCSALARGAYPQTVDLALLLAFCLGGGCILGLAHRTTTCCAARPCPVPEYLRTHPAGGLGSSPSVSEQPMS